MALLCLSLWLVFGLGCVSFQRRMLYHPEILSARNLDQLAKEVGLVRWTTPVGEHVGWMRQSPIQPAQGAVLITHGNAGCAVDRGDYATSLQQAAALDVFILEYPGFGDRPGSPTEGSLFAAADAAFGLLPTNKPIYLVGESLGTGVAAHLAGSRAAQVSGVLLVAPYHNLTDVAQHHIRLFPVRWFLADRFCSADYLRHYQGPLAVLLAGQDRIVPAKFGRRLFDAYAGPKRLWESPQATHNTLPDQPPEVWKEIVAFWN